MLTLPSLGLIKKLVIILNLNIVIVNINANILYCKYLWILGRDLVFNINIFIYFLIYLTIVVKKVLVKS